MRRFAIALTGFLLVVPATPASAVPILITWTGTATGALGSLRARGTITIDSSQIASDISVNGLDLTATVTDGVHEFTGIQTGFSTDNEMVLRFLNTDLNNLSVRLF